MSIFVAVTVPAVVAAAALGLRRVLGARKRSSQGDSTWSALAIGLAYIAGQAAVARPAFPPVDVTDRIPWLALAATVLAVAEAAWALAPWVRLFGRSLLLTLSLGLMLGPVVSANDLSRPMLGWLTVTAVLCFWRGSTCGPLKDSSRHGCLPRLDRYLERGDAGTLVLGKRRALPAGRSADGLTGRRPAYRMGPSPRERAHRG